MQEIIVEPDGLWRYLQEQDKNEQFRGAIYEIARNEEYGISVCVSKDKDGVYCITVDADDVEIYSDYICDEHEAEEVCSKIYDDYLTDKVIEILMDIDEESTLVQADEIEMREEELTELVLSFVTEVLGGDTYFDGANIDEIVDDCKEHFLEYMARKHGLAIYRPMILEDEDGEDFFEEYPYECMEFDDEDNPIYQP